MARAAAIPPTELVVLEDLVHVGDEVAVGPRAYVVTSVHVSERYNFADRETASSLVAEIRAYRAAHTREGDSS